MDNRDQFIDELAKVFAEEPEAQALLEDVGFPRAYWPNWNNFPNPRSYWARVVTEIENGRLPDQGPEALARAAQRQFPNNPIIRAAAVYQPPPLEPPEVRHVRPEGPQAHGPAAQGAAAQGAARRPAARTVWPTLIFQGSEHYDEFVRLVREIVGPPAELQYAAADEAAVLVPEDWNGDELLAQVRRAVTALDLGPDTEVNVRFERYGFPPHLIERLRLVGPDQQVFYAENVPNTTPVRDLPQALLAEYGEQTRHDRFGRTRRTVVDRVVPGARPGEAAEERLDPDRTLQEAGVREGDELHIRPESTAGAINPRLRRSALARVRNEIREYERGHADFRIVRTDDDYLPTEYEIEFAAPGFAPPGDLGVPAEQMRPEPRDQHRAVIQLSDMFPLKAPFVFFTTPMFHPNVELEGGPHRPKGWACIGALGDGAYRTDLDFHELCALIKDMAAYRNYGALPRGLLDAHGFLNLTAKKWAVSELGQQMIVARGGRALLPMLGIENAPPPKRLRVRRPAPAEDAAGAPGTHT